MDDMFKAFMVVLLVMYVVSPVDLCPGPIDDVIAILVALASRKVEE